MIERIDGKPLTLYGPSMALVHSNQTPVGKKAPGFSLPNIDGSTISLEDFAEKNLVVVVFTCNHCPYAKAVEERLVQLQSDYAAKGVQLVAINPNDASNYPADSFEAMKNRAAEKKFNFPYLRDESQEIAKAYDAACTPDFFILDKERNVVYNGRLDDNWQEPENVKHQDLRMALDTLLAGSKNFPFDVKSSMGCSIKWK